MTFKEQIDAARTLRKETKVLDSFIAGTVEGMFGPDGRYWLGPRLDKTAPQYAATLEKIKKNFLIQNLIGGILENHVDGFLSDEFEFQMMRGEAKADPETAALTRWYDAQMLQSVVYNAAITLLYALAGEQTSSMLRFFVPRRAAPSRRLALAPLEAQLLRAVRLSHVPTSQAGVLRESGDAIAGFFEYKDKPLGEPERNVLEFTALDSEFEYQGWTRLERTVPRGWTVLQLRTGTDYSEILAEGAYPLGGHLMIYEMQRKPLITEDVISQQAGLNTQWTYLNKHAGASAFLERVILNGLPPGKWVNDKGEPDENGKNYKPDTLEVGAGTTNFYGGIPDAEGKLTSPSIQWREPSSSEPLLKNIEAHRTAIFDLCNQMHRLISGDATATGIARQQAANDFVNSLGPTRRAVKAGAEWALETALRLGGYFESGTERYTDVTADVTLSLQAVQPTPDELRLAVELRDAGAFDTLELMRRVGVEATDEMLVRVEQERARSNPTPTDQLEEAANGRTQNAQGS